MYTKGVIFDMDGVVADTQKIHARLESEMLAGYGINITPAEITKRFAGISAQKTFGDIFKEANIPSPDLEVMTEEKVRRFQSLSSEFEALPGTLACIEMLYSRVPLAIASASRMSSVELVLNSIGVREYFKVLTSTKEVARGKPAPDVFLLAAKRLEVEPERCVVIEDAVSGMLGALAAGMRCIALVEDLSKDYPAHMIVRDLRDVPEYFFD